MCMDRVLPMSYFEKDKMSQGKSSVNITITGVGSKITEGEIIDAEVIDE